VDRCPKCGGGLFLRFCSGSWFMVCMTQFCDFMTGITDADVVKLTGRY
jgi:glutamine amidotransferase-like uncharacterized protein